MIFKSFYILISALETFIMIICVDNVVQFNVLMEKYQKTRLKIHTPNEMQSSRSFEPEFIPEDLHEGDRTEDSPARTEAFAL